MPEASHLHRFRKLTLPVPLLPERHPPDIRSLFAVASPTFELHYAIHKCEQCVIFTDAHVRARVDFGSALTNQDVAAGYCLTVSPFHAKTLRVGITSVLCGTYTFFDANN